MKSAFLFYDKVFYYDKQPPLGAMTLSAVLKEKGHQVRGFSFNKENIPVLIEQLKSYQPDFFLISSTTGFHVTYLEILPQIRPLFPEAIIVFGGPHATFNPEMIEHECIDIICRGEGEKALVELLEAVENGKDYTHILNLWVKYKGKIFKNDLRPLLNEEDLNKLPPLDYELLDCFEGLFTNSNTRFFMAGRGCPFNCSYCFNHKYRKLTTGKYVRFRSPEVFIKEIHHTISHSPVPVEILDFQDDIFIINKEWLQKFTELYKKEINLPYFCHVEMSLLNQDICNLLEESNCKVATFGLENGNPALRQKILNKKVTDRAIIEGTKMLRKNGIFVVSQNIIGIPFETNETACDTMDLNRRAGVDAFNYYFYIPYPKTELKKIAIDHGFLVEDRLPSSYYETLALKFPYPQNFEELRYLAYMGKDFWLAGKLIRYAYKKNSRLRRLIRKLLIKIYVKLYNTSYNRFINSSRPDIAVRQLKKIIPINVSKT